ncbi:UNVERIFIED_CONTAM: hypothetical protein GTU68_054159 [Idotea baltica]|nr:hypothetical protein [Idotea baltica]
MAGKEMKPNYKLRCSLIGHSMDVRAVAVSPEGDIVTASRDKTAKLWKESKDNCCIYEEKVVYEGHTAYVTSVCLIPGNDECPDGYTVTGSKDSTVLVFPRSSSTPSHTLTGHTDTVSCLIWKNNLLVSGGWDHSIRIWKDWECLSQLRGHSGPVWSVAIADMSSSMEYLVISASADKTLKSWKGGKEVMTYSGHTDCVRGVSLLDSERFVSCSNDASVRFWNVSGECLATCYGHTSFIYSIYCSDPSSGFVSGGEDRTIRVWDTAGTNSQTIYLPSQSVWAVAILPNSDIVAGSSDGICRVFTSSVDRQADVEEQKQFEDSLAQFKVAIEDVGGIKKSELPDKTFLFTPGKRDGQTVMIREGDKVLCYSWSASKNEWDAVGEVVGGAGGSANTSGKVLYQGREYDFVFDVDLDEGRVIKLPYNRGEDPWIVAQAFIHQHELPQDYLDQVANFITTNAKVSATSIGQSSSYFDPFTGGSRYVPSAGSAPSVSNGDPFTGSGRYVPPSTSAAPVTAQPTVTSQYFPQTVPLKFESINKAGILAKLEESNALVSDPLSEEQVQSLVEAVVSPSVTASDLSPLEKALQWAPEKVWPALDVLRLALRSEEAHERWMVDGKGDGIVALLVSFLHPPIPLPTQLLALRCLANMASHQPGREVLSSSRNSVVTTTVSLAPYANKNLEIAAATLILNYCTIFKSEKDIEDHCQLLSATATVGLTINDPEAQFRVLVAMGTLLSYGKEVKSLALSLDMKPIIENLAFLKGPQKVGDCAKHVLRLL